jgi:predicted transposase/invertase (TIGR01784 family)
MQQISPRVDIAFKKIFGVEENKDLLISLINSVVSHEDQVVDVTLLNPYNAQNFKHDRLSILDIKAKGLDGKRFNIEIQISDEADYDKRALYYWAKLYTEQLKITEDYSTLCKAIGIHILNFISIVDSPKYHNVFHIKEKESNLLYFKDLELHTLELKKFSSNANEELLDLIAKVKNSLDLWLAFLTRHDLLRSRDYNNDFPAQLNIEPIKKAMHVLDVMNFAQEERDLYEDHLKWLRIEANTLKKYGDEALAKGREEGRLEGREEGREEKSIEIAKKMLTKGRDIEEIIELTGISTAEIKKLICKS